jgi:branched-chain amino acid transport system substrate-binding protein
MRTGNIFVGAAFALLAGGMAHSALAQDIKIGEINSYSLLPAFTEPYRKGWQLAVEEINAAGGINGKKLVVISKDDGGKPADAQTAANELVSSEGVAMLTGTFLSNIGLAVSDFANQKKVFFLAAEPLTDAVTWSKGNKYTFRLRPSNYMQAAMLVEAASKLPAKRWATIAPNYEYGQSAVAVFKKLMSEKRPDIQWVDEQWPPQGKIDAGPVVQAVAAANPISSSSCVKATPAACSRDARSSRSSPASPNISIRSRRRRPKAGSSQAIPGTRSRRPSTTRS